MCCTDAPKKKKKSEFSYQLLFRPSVNVSAIEPKKKKKKTGTVNGATANGQTDPPRVGLSKFFAMDQWPVGQTQEYTGR